MHAHVHGHESSNMHACKECSCMAVFTIIGISVRKTHKKVSFVMWLAMLQQKLSLLMSLEFAGRSLLKNLNSLLQVSAMLDCMSIFHLSTRVNARVTGSCKGCMEKLEI